MRVSRALPAEFKTLGARQRELIQVIHARGGATIRELHARIPGAPPTIYGLRTLLRRMVKRGLVRARPSGRHRELIYLPAINSSDVQLRAFGRIAKEHFHGSKFRAAEALENMARTELA